MSGFSDPTAAERAKRRIGELAQFAIDGRFDELFDDCPRPDLALSNLERWLRAASNPATQLEHLLSAPRMGRLVVLLFGASQPLADALVQNPELAALITDPIEVSRQPVLSDILEEGRTLLAVAAGHSHVMDRLRYLKQRWTVRIAVNDLAGHWKPEAVWRAISDLAEALIVLAHEACWNEYAAQKGLHVPCPVAALAFGKLAGRELNYSSDVDLVYVRTDDDDEIAERHASRFCEVLTRALSERMGRGNLYRVDLRLRPFGGLGQVVPTMRAVEAYYRSKAELWEAQALVRSRFLVGPADIGLRWERLREEHCFRPRVSSAAIEQFSQVRKRVEDAAGDDDVKRGPGGIRDVEFLAQVLAMIHGADRPELRETATLDVLRGLRDARLVKKREAADLAAGYAFLRTLEHRLQIIGDRQTHAIPDSPAARDLVARLMNQESWQAVAREIRAHRKRIRTVFDAYFSHTPALPDARSTVLDALGDLADVAVAWLESLPEPEAFYRSLSENRDSLRRVRQLLLSAPALASSLGKDVSTTEAIISGEIEEQAAADDFFETLADDAPLSDLAAGLIARRLRLAARWALDPTWRLGPALTALWDDALRYLHGRLNARFDLLALGSYAVYDCSLASDLDLLLLVERPEDHGEAERHAEQFLTAIAALKRGGVSVAVDLRLRPEGAKGLLVRTYDGLRAYDLHGMEMWERFALGDCRRIVGSPDAEALTKKVAYARPLTPERLSELLHVKARIEAERVPAKHRRRHIKLGEGGISDVAWFVHLHEMRYPTATMAGLNTTYPDRLRALFNARLINALEYEALTEGRDHLLALRDRLELMGFTTDVVPENPARLEALAVACGFEGANAFLAEHERIRHAVRSIFLEGVERLTA